MVTLYIKGAPEEILKYCNQQLEGGNPVAVNHNQIQNILSNIVNRMAAAPLRCISFGYVQMSYDDWQNIYERGSERPEDVIEEHLRGGNLELCYLGTFGVKD